MAKGLTFNTEPVAMQWLGLLEHVLPPVLNLEIFFAGSYLAWLLG